MKRDKEKIAAILDEDLLGLLIKINKYDEFIMGELTCTSCGEPISEKNLTAIVPKKDAKFEFVCNNIKCYEVLQGI